MLEPMSLYLGPLQRANSFSSSSDPGLANITKSSDGSTDPRLAVVKDFIFIFALNDARLSCVDTDPSQQKLTSGMMLQMLHNRRLIPPGTLTLASSMPMAQTALPMRGSANSF